MASAQSMVPTLQVIQGPLVGRLFKLDREVTSIGRNPDNDIVLEPKSVSRRHAAIIQIGPDYVLKDLGSTRGTFVQSQRLGHPVALQNGWTIQIGDVVFLFKTQAVQIHDGDLDSSTVFAAIDLSAPNDPSLAVVKPEEKLRALQKINSSFGHTLQLGELLDEILASLFDLFPHAERGFVLLQDSDRSKLIPEAIRTRAGSSEEPSISKSILDRVLKNGQAVLSRDLPAEFPNSMSVTESRIRSLMCVPIMDRSRQPLGILQIDTREGKSQFSQDDLDLLASIASQISVAVQNAQLHQALLKKQELEKELDFARQVLQALLPVRPAHVAGYEFWECYEPARQLGGDYFGFIALDDAGRPRPEHEGKWAIAVGDVVGKGFPAALMTAKLSAEIRLFLQWEADPLKVVTRLNEQLCENGVLEMFVTFLLLTLDPVRHCLRVVNAGHPCPLLRRRDGSVEEIGRESSGLPLAIQEDWAYEATEICLEPGDVVVLYTDGVTDALSPDGRRFGEARIHPILAKAAPRASAAGEAIMQAVHQHFAGRAQFDDITVVALGRM
jgi:serine phosphatase RsbU (regulator of sigma subunit)